jgi:TonB family protein
MLKIILTRSLLLAFSLTFFCGAGVFAQTTCSLRLNLSGPDSVPVSDAAAKAVLTKTKKIYDSSAQDEMPYFSALPIGVYAVRITKAGYKQTKLNVAVDCADRKSTDLFAVISVMPGSPKQSWKISDVIARTIPGPLEGVAVGPADGNASVSPPATDQSAAAERQPVNKGVLNGFAISLPAPKVLPTAKAMGASGTVIVQVLIDEDGNVVSATSTSGHPLLRGSAVDAARKARFKPTLLSGVPIKVSGVIVYKFR